MTGEGERDARQRYEAALRDELGRTRATCEGEREARQRCEAALREKDAAMGVLFERLRAAGVDCSDLIP